MMLVELLTWVLGWWSRRRAGRQELVRLRAENARLAADLVAAQATIGQLRADAKFYYDAFTATMAGRKVAKDGRHGK